MPLFGIYWFAVLFGLAGFAIATVPPVGPVHKQRQSHKCEDSGVCFGQAENTAAGGASNARKTRHLF
jgi:hypothetical protein